MIDKKDFFQLEASIIAAINELKKVQSDNSKIHESLQEKSKEIAKLKEKLAKLNKYVGSHFIKKPVELSSNTKKLEVFVYGEKAKLQQENDVKSSENIDRIKKSIIALESKLQAKFIEK